VHQFLTQGTLEILGEIEGDRCNGGVEPDGYWNE
jgi:hypothetical protein